MSAAILEKYPSLKKYDDDNYPEVSAHSLLFLSLPPILSMFLFPVLCQQFSLLKCLHLLASTQEGDGREARVLAYIESHPTIAEARGNPAKILALMDEFSAQQDFLISVGPDKERLLTGIIAAEAPRVLVELGGYVGYSAILFAAAMKCAAPAGSSVVVYSLEFNKEYADVATKIVELAGLSDAVRIVVGAGDESLRRLKDEGKLTEAGEGSIDVLFLDHLEALYVKDLKAAEELGLLKAGALVLADNVVRPGAPDYVKYVRAHPRFQSHGMKSLIVPGDAEVCLFFFFSILLFGISFTDFCFVFLNRMRLRLRGSSTEDG